MRRFWNNIGKGFTVVLFILSGLMSLNHVNAQQLNKEEEWTDNKFPSYIKRMNQFG